MGQNRAVSGWVLPQKGHFMFFNLYPSNNPLRNPGLLFIDHAPEANVNVGMTLAPAAAHDNTQGLSGIVI